MPAVAAFAPANLPPSLGRRGTSRLYRARSRFDRPTSPAAAIRSRRESSTSWQARGQLFQSRPTYSNEQSISRFHRVTSRSKRARWGSERARSGSERARSRSDMRLHAPDGGHAPWTRVVHCTGSALRPSRPLDRELPRAHERPRSAHRSSHWAIRLDFRELRSSALHLV